MKRSKSLFASSIFALNVLFLSCTNESASVETETTPAVETIEEQIPPVKAEIVDSKADLSKAKFTIPEGYVLFDKIEGDLNGDGINDHVLMIKGTDSAYVVINRFDDEVDRNRRGILIYLSDKDNYVLAIKNLSCFYSDQEDGGVYFPPELSISISNNKLYFDYAHGRYGFWQYTFRYQDSDFALIGYDASQNYGPIVNRVVSINFLTKKRLTKENVNQDIEESGEEVFKETWDKIELDELYTLSQIKEFEDLDIKF
jgi:hypothetical protein